MIISRSEARELGLKRYDTGQPCRYGHFGGRYVAEGRCAECWRLKNEKRRGRLRNRPDYVPKPRKISSHPKVIAKAAGALTYRGKPCKRGHASERYVSSGQCLECAVISRRSRAGSGIVYSEAQLVIRRKRSRGYKAAKRAALLAAALPRVSIVELRKTALSAGDLTYVGRPCKLGHGQLRCVKTSICVTCAKKLERNKPNSKLVSTAAERAKRREKARKYKARRRAAGPNYTAADIVWLKKRQGGKCGICLLAIGGAAWEVDHRVPLADGGTNDRLNLHITHMLCNRSKGKRHEIEYAQERFGRLL